MLETWKRIVQGTFSVIYLTLLILTIPLAFDVGGEDCGIAFTSTLTIFYFVMSTIRIITRKTKFSIIGSLLYYLQHLITPSLLILHLSLFSNTKSNNVSSIWLNSIHPWKVMIKNATPVFACMEGFCTLLVIQATGHVMRWLNNKKSDSWMFVQIIFSGVIITGSLYFLYRIYTFPVVMDLASATLIGAVLTISLLLGFYGIVSGKGNVIESSLLFAYIVYCLYVTFTDFQTTITSNSILSFLFSTSSSSPTSSTTASFLSFMSPKAKSPLELISDNSRSISSSPQQQQAAAAVAAANIPPLPPIIVTSYTNFVSTIAELVPQGFVTVFDFFKGAFSTITPSVVVSLTFRLFVFYAATRIIPAVRDPNSFKRKPSNSSKSQAGLFVVYAYAPCLIIAVYTNLLMQHFGILGTSETGETWVPVSQGGLWQWVVQHFTNSQLSWQFWGWINMFFTLALYSVELIYGKESSGEVLVERHFKQD